MWMPHMNNQNQICASSREKRRFRWMSRVFLATKHQNWTEAGTLPDLQGRTTQLRKSQQQRSSSSSVKQKEKKTLPTHPALSSLPRQDTARKKAADQFHVIHNKTDRPGNHQIKLTKPNSEKNKQQNKTKNPKTKVQKQNKTKLWMLSLRCWIWIKETSH